MRYFFRPHFFRIFLVGDRAPSSAHAFLFSYSLRLTYGFLLHDFELPFMFSPCELGYLCSIYFFRTSFRLELLAHALHPAAVYSHSVSAWPVGCAADLVSFLHYFLLERWLRTSPCSRRDAPLARFGTVPYLSRPFLPAPAVL